MAVHSDHAGTIAGTVGGTLASIFANIQSEDIIETIVLSVGSWCCCEFRGISRTEVADQKKVSRLKLKASHMGSLFYVLSILYMIAFLAS